MLGDPEPWEELAWLLWRRRFTMVEISRFLAIEGWRAQPWHVEEVVMQRLERELEARERAREARRSRA